MPAKTHWRLRFTSWASFGVTIPEIQMMTTPGGADQCTGGTASANDEDQPAANAFDDATGTYWRATTTDGNSEFWILYNFGTAKDIVEYTIREAADGNNPLAWVLECKDLADPSWTAAHTQDTWVTWSGSGTEVKAFSVPVPPVEYDIPSFSTSQTFLSPNYHWSVPRIAREFYRCVLTGAPDGTSDLVLPASSFQFRLRDGDPSYLSIVVPNGGTYAAGIDARQNGELVVYKGVEDTEGNQNLAEIARVALETVRPDEGARSYSVTLTGHRTSSSTSAKTLTIDGASYRSVDEGGKRRYRSQTVALHLRPGDTAQINGESIVVGAISTAVGDKYSQMEIVEA